MSQETPTEPIIPGSRKSESLEKRVTILEFQVGAMSEKQDRLCKSVQDIRDCLYGDETSAGVIERLRRLDEIVGDVKKIGWAILAVLIGLAVTSIFNLVMTHPLP